MGATPKRQLPRGRVCLRLGISLPPRYVERVRAHCERRGIRISELMRRALDAYLDPLERVNDYRQPTSRD